MVHEAAETRRGSPGRGFVVDTHRTIFELERKIEVRQLASGADSFAVRRDHTFDLSLQRELFECLAAAHILCARVPHSSIFLLI